MRLADVLDAANSVDESLVEWTYEGQSAFAFLNGHKLETRSVGYANCYGYIDDKFVDGADNRPDVMVSLIASVCLK